MLLVGGSTGAFSVISLRPMTNFRSAAYILTLALLVWGAALSISSRLSVPRAPGEKKQTERGNTMSGDLAGVSAETKALKAEAERKPDEIAPRLALAHALVTEGIRLKDANVVMEAVKNFAAVLRQDADNAEALLGMANISMETGVFDKAVEYYSLYLAKHPEDLKAKTDYALALLQGGDSGSAIKTLKEVIAKEPKQFAPRLSLALAYRVAGEKKQAREAALEAKKFAPEKLAEQLIDEFVVSLDRVETKAATPKSPSDTLSPAMLVEEYFRNHEIVGPKVQRIIWPESSLVRVEVKDFPVDKMPPFARDKFLKNMSEQFAVLSEKLKIQIADETSGAVMLELEVGGASK